MGEDVTATVFSREDRQRYRQKVRACLDVFARMLAESRFDPERRSMGLEIELNLTDEAGDPALLNADVLERIADPDFTTELAQFNVEINIPPRLLAGPVFSELEPQVRDSLNAAEDKAHGAGAHMMLVGILPTISEQHLNADSFSANPRYKLLNEQIFAARGEDLQISINGPERLSTFADTIAPEAACTSVQLHQQVEPRPLPHALERRAGDRRGAARDRRQLAVLLRPRAVAGDADRAVRAGHRHAPGGAQGAGRAPARVVRRALDHVDLRPLRGERHLLPGAAAGVRARGPGRGARAGGVPKLGELRLHNGTVYRWNRPVYDVVRGKPHLRVENRVLPAGPTVVDTLANAAFYYGLVRMLVEEERPIWSRMSFSAAEENFHAGARDGIEARVFWPGLGEVPASELVLRRLLPLAHEGLNRWEVDPATASGCSGSSSSAASPSATGRPGRPRRSTGSTTTRAWTASRRCAR